MALLHSPLGIYVSIPFCRAKCSFCNFASDAFPASKLPRYLDALSRELEGVGSRLAALGAVDERAVDSVYFGGGTPSLLEPEQVRRVFAALRGQFDVAADAEMTVECAPKQLKAETLAAFQDEGVNRLSFGMQSFVDRETSAVGRLHTAGECLNELMSVRSQGVHNIGVDLIAGLPFQTEETWRRSLRVVIESAVPHVSVYLFEIDDASRLGREVLQSGQRYSAGAVPGEEEMARFYEIACEELGGAGVPQYEISNFARPGYQSRHNLKYWQRRPYLGFGLDAHSMCERQDGLAVRFCNTDSLEEYLAASENGCVSAGDNPLFAQVLPGRARAAAEVLSETAVFEETLFLGLRMSAGLRLTDLRGRFPSAAMRELEPVLATAETDGLMLREGDWIRLTDRGRLLSNEVFERLLVGEAAA